MNDFIKNPQTRNARAFSPLIISAVGSVLHEVHFFLGKIKINSPLVTIQTQLSGYLLDIREMIYFFRHHEIFISWFVANSVKMGEKKPNTAIKSQVVKNVQTILYVPMQ